MCWNAPRYDTPPILEVYADGYPNATVLWITCDGRKGRTWRKVNMRHKD